MKLLLAVIVTALALLVVAACTKHSDESPGKSPSYSATSVDPNDPKFKQGVKERLDAMKQEQQVREDAPWFGKTGLADDEERELPRYLRREYGQLLIDTGSLKAADLEYLGVFIESVETVHYWKIHDSDKEPHYAYIVSAPEDRRVIGWGDRTPPK